MRRTVPAVSILYGSKWHQRSTMPPVSYHLPPREWGLYSVECMQWAPLLSVCYNCVWTWDSDCVSCSGFASCYRTSITLPNPRNAVVTLDCNGTRSCQTDTRGTCTHVPHALATTALSTAMVKIRVLMLVWRVPLETTTVRYAVLALNLATECVSLTQTMSTYIQCCNEATCDVNNGNITPTSIECSWKVETNSWFIRLNWIYIESLVIVSQHRTTSYAALVEPLYINSL